MENGVTSDGLESKKRMFDDARNLTSEAREQALIDDDYYHGRQLTPQERLELEKRGQPDIVINRVRPAINGILGVVEQGRSDPRAFPRTPEDEDSADVATDVLRFIADKNRFSQLKIQCFQNMLINGTMAAIVKVDDDLNVDIQQIRFEEFFFDPRARRNDFSDARYVGIAKWMYADDVTEMYPQSEAANEAAIADASNIIDASYEDRPTGQFWVDRKTRRMMVVEVYYRRGQKWMRCVYNSATVLEEGESPYLDAKGKPCNPIVAHSAYVNRDNDRYGIIRDMRGPQDEVNKRRSKLLHLVSVSQIQAVDPSAMAVDASIARKEAARPDGVIPFGWQKVPTTDMASGQSQLLLEAKSEIERLGPNPAVLGRSNSDASGRAQLVRQQAGMVELGVLFGALEDWELRLYRESWARVKQYWKENMFIRVTDDEDSPKFVELNKPKKAMQPMVVMGPDGIPMIVEQEVILGYENQLSEMDIDIVLDSVPDTANLQQEQFQDLMKLVASNPQYAQSVPFEVMVEMSSLPRKRQMIDKMKRMREEGSQAQATMQQEQAETAKRGAAAQIAKVESDAALNQAKARKEEADVVLMAISAQQIPQGVS